MRLWIKLLIGVLALGLVLVAGAAVFISQMDPNEYRGAVADAVEGATGRKLHIGGDLRVSLLPVPSLEANDVTFANASWASQPYMARVKRLRAAVALLPLLEGRVVIRSVDATEPEVHLQTGTDDKKNWQFAGAPKTDAEAGATSKALQFVVDQVRIEKAAIDYVDGKTGSTTALQVSELTVDRQRLARRTAVAFSAAYQNLPMTLTGTLGPSGAVLNNQPVELDLKGALGDAEFNIAGTVGKPLEGKAVRLDVYLNTKSTRELTELAGVDVEEAGPMSLKLTVIEADGRLNLHGIDMTALPRDVRVTVKGSVEDIANNPRPELEVDLSAKSLQQLDKALPGAGPVSLSAKLQPKAQVIEIRELVAQVGKSDLSGSATLDTSGERPRAKAKLNSKVIDLSEIAPAAKQAGSEAGAGPARDGKVFSDAPLPLDALNKLDADIELSVARLVTHKLSLDSVKLMAKLDTGNLTVNPAAQVAGGSIGGTISIDSHTRPAKFTADVEASKVSIGTLTNALRGFETAKGLDSNLQMKLESQGDSVRVLMGGLDGDFRLDIGEGRLNNDVLDRAGADIFLQMIRVAVPSDEKDATTDFKCGVVRFTVKQGDAVADQTLVMETDKVLLNGGGLVDLKTEKLDLGAHLAARKGIRIGPGTLSSLVRVQGTLADPRLGTDLRGLAKTGAKVGIAVVTAGLSLLAESVYGHVSEDDKPCETALTRSIDVNPSVWKSLLK